MKNIIKLESEDDFHLFMEKIIDFENINLNEWGVESPVISIKLEGEKFNASLTGSIIAGLNKYQETVYKVYRQNKYGSRSKKKLSPEEVKNLEINVKISEGSTDLLITFFNSFLGGTNMNDSTIITVATILSGAWLIKGLVTPAIKGHFKTAQKKIDAQLEESKTKSDNEKAVAYFENVQKSFQDMRGGMVKFLEYFIEANPKNIVIDKKNVSISDIEDYKKDLKEKKIEEPQERHYSVEGRFTVLNLNYESNITKMKALHIDSGITYTDISLQNDWITEENYQAVINAENREPLFFKIIIYEKGKKRKCAIDVDSIKTNNDLSSV